MDENANQYKVGMGPVDRSITYSYVYCQHASSFSFGNENFKWKVISSYTGENNLS